MSVGSFCVGHPFQYQISKSERNAEYHVRARYDNFKEEIMNYSHFSYIRNYKNEVLPKANIYMATTAVKLLQDQSRNLLQLSVDQVISVILYTDYTDLSCHFTSTFRKQEPWELLNSIKVRNSKYAWWSRFLRETVYNLGSTGYGHCQDDNCHKYIKLSIGCT